MVLLIDNYDSFSYNLYQLVGEQNEAIKVIRNDELTIEEIQAIKPSHIILSPGPGKPKDAGICEAVVECLGEKIPILGVCLGHQAICEVFGATVTYAGAFMHGKQSTVNIDNSSVIFQGLNAEIKVARYHSLAAKRETISEELRVIGTSADGEVMAVEHKQYPIYGLQFHPESIMTPEGKMMIRNFLNI